MPWLFYNLMLQGSAFTRRVPPFRLKPVTVTLYSVKRIPQVILSWLPLPFSPLSLEVQVFLVIHCYLGSHPYTP